MPTVLDYQRMNPQGSYENGYGITMSTTSINTSGDNTVVTVTAGSTPRMFRVGLMPSADITGTITVKLGSTSIYAVVNPKAGAEYGFDVAPKYVNGTGNIIVNLPGTTAVQVNLTYQEVITP